MTTSSTPKTRTSARQAAARQRIAQRDSPAGSAPPFETSMTKWTSNPSKTAERELIVSMVEYLRDDPVVINDLAVFRFICRDWYVLERTLHTKATIDTIKRRLVAMGVRYIHRTLDMNWHYWNDYTPLAIMDFYPMPEEEQLETPRASPSSADIHPRPKDTEDIPPTVQLHPSPGVESIQEYAPDPTAQTEHTSPEQMPFVPPRHSTSPSGAAAYPVGSRTTDSSSTTDTSTEDEVVYLRTQKPVPEDKDWDTSEDEGHNPDAAAMPHTSKRGIPNTSARNDEDGFTPVPMRHNRKYRRSQTPTTPIFETQSQVPQKQTKPALDKSPTLRARSPQRRFSLLNVQTSIRIWTNNLSTYRSKWTPSRRSYKNVSSK